jgi:8-oxo-dGTP pyrophosphatase MutT (NUDIX family)
LLDLPSLSLMSSAGARPGRRTWTLPGLEAKLREGLSVLPGVEAQALFAPRPRRSWRVEQRLEGPRPAAALVLLYTRENRPHLVLTVRADLLARHGGQVSFPGGAIEPGEAIASAALREAAEEIGIDPSVVRIVGPLTPLHIPVSDFIVHPIVGVMDHMPVFSHAATEVARVLEVPFDDLLDPARMHETTRMRDEVVVEVPYFDIGGEQVWGATAMMLSELIWVLGEREVLPARRP